MTFEAPKFAVTARNEVGGALTCPDRSISILYVQQMNGGMIRGVDVVVNFASEENGYVELTPEAASNPWAMIGRQQQFSINVCYNQLDFLFICLQLRTEVSKNCYL